MPRVPCPACATDVVVDPLGRCPEGHDVATAVDRVTSAIGTATDHPHEPEPWIATVEADEVDDTAMAEPAPVQPRRPEPVRAPGHEPQPMDDEVAADDLLSELHSLTEPTPNHDRSESAPDPTDATDGSSAGGPAAGAPAAGAAPEPTTDASAPVMPSTPTTSSGLGELEAALRDLTDIPASNGSGPGHPVATPDASQSTNGVNGHHPLPSDDAEDVATSKSTNGDRSSGPQLDLGDLDDLFSGMGTPPAATPPRGTPPSDGSSDPTPPPASPPIDGPAPATNHGAEASPTPPTLPAEHPTPPPPTGPPPGAPSPSPTADEPSPTAPTPPPSTDASTADAPSPAAPPDVDDPSANEQGLDLANFTAKGGKVDRKGKRRRFGR